MYRRLLVLLSAVLLSASWMAQAESPDSMFGSDGREAFHATPDADAPAMREESDGSIASEQLDAGFGTGGRVQQSLFDRVANGVAIFGLRDGRHVSFITGPDGANVEYIEVTLRDADGSVRLGRGFTSVHLETTLRAALDSRERLIVVGTTNSQVAPPAKFRVFRFQYVAASNSYEKDTGFGTNGVVDVEFNGKPARARAVAIDGNDSIVVAGEVELGATDTDFAIARLRGSDGSLDTSFNGTGTRTVAFDLGSADWLDSAYAVAMTPDDAAITVVGSAYDNAGGKFRVAMARLLPNGGLDTAFCATSCLFNPHPSIHDGRRTYYFGSAANDADNVAMGVTHVANGDMLIAGRSEPVPYGPSSGAIARFFPSGAYRTEVLETVPGYVLAYHGIQAVDAAGSRILVSGMKRLTVPGEGQFVLQAFDGSSGLLSRTTGFGNCLTNDSAHCFTGSGDGADWHVENDSMVTIDASGRGLFAGTFLPYGDPPPFPRASFVRFTNNTGPKPDRIFRNGFQ